MGVSRSVSGQWSSTSFDIFYVSWTNLELSSRQISAVVFDTPINFSTILTLDVWRLEILIKPRRALILYFKQKFNIDLCIERLNIPCNLWLAFEILRPAGIVRPWPYCVDCSFKDVHCLKIKSRKPKVLKNSHKILA